MHSNTVPQYSPNILRNLKYLQKLEIKLARFENGPIFNQLNTSYENLELNIIDCRFKNFTNGIFAMLPTVQSIALMGNGLATLPDQLFAHNRKLIWIKLQESQLKTISNQSFPNQIASVNMSSCSLNSMPNDLFRNCTKLFEIDIRSNQLVTLPTDLFADQTSMARLLYLDFNLLNDLPIGIFDKLNALRILSLSNNRLANISMDLFSHMDKLTDLNLSNNRLHSIHSSLKAMHSIHLKLNALNRFGRLDLSFNYLSTGLFENCLQPKIEFLDLRNNTIADMQLSLPRLW